MMKRYFSPVRGVNELIRMARAQEGIGTWRPHVSLPVTTILPVGLIGISI
jgi:hypothetical protein